MTYLIETHLHTNFSKCSGMSPKQAISYTKSAGLSGMIITDHNTLAGYESLKKKPNDFVVIPGIEVSTGDGDILGFFIKENIPRQKTAFDAADKIREQGGLVSIPHPFDPLRKCAGKLTEELKPDFIEVFNARIILSKYNRLAEEVAEELKIKKIAGSDAHFKEEVGQAGIVLEKLDDIRGQMEKGHYSIFGNYSSPMVHLKSFIAKRRP